MTLRARLAKAILNWLLTHSGESVRLAEMEASAADARALATGLRADHDAAVDAITRCAKQQQQTASIVRGILIKHQAYEAASKPLMTAARRLNAKVKRAAKEQQDAQAKRDAAKAADLTITVDESIQGEPTLEIMEDGS